MSMKTDTKLFIKKVSLNFSNFFKKKIPVNIPVLKGSLLQNRVALVTGGSSGIGLAIAKSFLEQGATVIITGRNIKKLENCTKELKKNYKNILFVDLNLEDVESFEKKIEEIDCKLDGKKIDILVNNAGVFSSKKFDDTTIDEYDEVMDTNLKGMYFLSQKVYQYMKKNKIHGNILNIASSSSIRPAINPYSLSKWGVKGLTIGMAKKFIDAGIVVNGIAPGPTSTNMINNNNDNISKSQYPLSRYIMPEEVANLAVFLTSDMGKMIVGDIIYMTGGLGITTVDDLNY